MLKRLRESRLSIWESAKALADRAANENRGFNGEENAQWENLNAELDQYDQRIKSVIDAETRSKDADEAFARLTGQQVGLNLPNINSGGGINAQLRNLRLGEGLEIPFGARSYFRPGLEEVRSTLTTTSPSGMMPADIAGRILMHLIDGSALLSAGATVINSQTGEDLLLPTSSADSTSLLTGEAAAITASDPTYLARTLKRYKYGHLVEVSNELLRDNAFDLAGYLAEESARAISTAWGNDAMVGNGTSKPTGITTVTTMGKTGATGLGGGFGAQASGVGYGGDVLADLMASLKETYIRQPSCAWMMRSSTLNTIRKLRDSQGRYVFSLDAPGNSRASGSIFGRPVYVDAFMAEIGTSAKSVLFGDFSRVYVRFIRGVRFENSIHFKFDQDLTVFRAIIEMDSCLVDQTGAVKHFVGGAS
jgi:HK97 family phage major capsid protein